MKIFAATWENTEAMKVIPNKPFPSTLSGVGKFHARAHKNDCRTKWGFNFLPGSQMTDGEASERVWPSVNEKGQSTREMNPGNRHDRINRQYGDRNIQRVYDMCTSRISMFENLLTQDPPARFLTRKYKDATTHLPRVTENLQKLEDTIVENLGADGLEAWKAEEKEWKEKVVILSEKKNLLNPYDLEPVSSKCASRCPELTES